MTHKTTHVHPDALEAVEDFYDDDGNFISQVVHTTSGKKFGSSTKQETDRNAKLGMITIRGDLIKDNNQ